MFESRLEKVPSKSICLGCWLTMPHPKYSELVEQIRSCPEKDQRTKLKGKLPVITAAGVFKDRYILEQYSGLACIDIDGQDNLHIKDWDKVKRMMRSLSYVAYAGLSCGGNGLMVMARIKQYESQKTELYPIIRADFNHFGIKLDETRKGGSDIRYYSIDYSPYVNHNALVLEKPRKAITPKTNTTEHVVWSEFNRTGDLKAFLGNYIQSNSQEFGYAEWIRIGIALANELGEEGRHYFHELSKPDQRYKPGECDKVYSDLLNRKYDEVSGGTIRFLLMQ